ncbi:hypothetical protein EO92_15630 [Methanosarcina sp. 2.H.A.1B.4]|nr:hypothetical protein EO92_15630 [Methanosarcina sp. 2.H.A.1B.4]
MQGVPTVSPISEDMFIPVHLIHTFKKEVDTIANGMMTSVREKPPVPKSPYETFAAKTEARLISKPVPWLTIREWEYRVQKSLCPLISNGPVIYPKPICSTESTVPNQSVLQNQPFQTNLLFLLRINGLKFQSGSF